MQIIDHFTNVTNLVNNAPLPEVLEFAKKYDLNFVAQSTFYNYTVDIIKQRLYREGITDINNVNK